MLAKVNRIVDAAGFRRVMRIGRKITTPHLVMYVAPSSGSAPQVGFVVSGKYGNAIARNTVRRRLRARVGELIRSGSLGSDLVIRVRADAGIPDWATLGAELHEIPTLGASRSFA
ncbi:MAG: ribonuclease P protein component [Microbacteriaceae bacterium]